MDAVAQKIADIVGLPFLRESSGARTRELLFDTGIDSRYEREATTGRIIDRLHEQYRGLDEKLKSIPEYHFIATGRSCMDRNYTISVYMDPVGK